jgi:Aminotransferase class-III
VPNTNFYRAPDEVAGDEKQFALWAANRVEEAILHEGPDSVAAVFVEPVQNAGGCIPAPPGYFERLRQICDAYEVLLVSDEVICAYGRLGTMFGAQKYSYQPDIITSAKGLTSGYSPLGAATISDAISNRLLRETPPSPTATRLAGIRCPGRSRWLTLIFLNARTCLATYFARRVHSGRHWNDFMIFRSLAMYAGTVTSTPSSW